MRREKLTSHGTRRQTAEKDDGRSGVDYSLYAVFGAV